MMCVYIMYIVYIYLNLESPPKKMLEANCKLQGVDSFHNRTELKSFADRMGFVFV